MKQKICLMLLLSMMVVWPTTAQTGNGVAEAVRGDTASSGFVADLLHWYDANMNYTAVAALMTIESSLFRQPFMWLLIQKAVEE